MQLEAHQAMLHEMRQAERMVRTAVECAGGVDSKQNVTITVSPRMAWLFADHLQQFDPDMPAPALCKALGPLGPALADMMTNAKLRRLDETIRMLATIADSLGPNVIRLMMIADQIERRHS